MDIGKNLIFIGSLIALLGVLVVFFNKYSWFGNLIGDFKYESEEFKLYAPFSSMIIVSLFITIVLNVLNKFFK